MLDETGELKAASDAIYTYRTLCHFGKIEYGGSGRSGAFFSASFSVMVLQSSVE